MIIAASRQIPGGAPCEIRCEHSSLLRRSMALLPAIEFPGSAFNAIHRTTSLLHRTRVISAQAEQDCPVSELGVGACGEDPPHVLTGRGFMLWPATVATDRVTRRRRGGWRCQ